MARYRLTLAGSMALILAVAVAFAALRNASHLWAGAAYLLTLGFLCTAIVGAVSRRGPARIPWVGAAIFGWAYASLSLGPWAIDFDVPLPTKPLLKAVLPYVRPGLMGTDGATFEGHQEFMTMPGTGVKVYSITPYFRVGHCLITWLFAATGAVVGVVMSRGHSDESGGA